MRDIIRPQQPGRYLATAGRSQLITDRGVHLYTGACQLAGPHADQYANASACWDKPGPVRSMHAVIRLYTVERGAVR